MERYEYKARHMGVIARIVVYSESKAKAEVGVRVAFSRIAELESIFSNYQRTSEVARLQLADAGNRVAVSAELATVIKRTTELWELSRGAFDPTVGPLTELWRRSRAAGALPADSTVARMRLRTGWQHVRLDSTQTGGYTVSLHRAGLAFDFGGIAKGYACDEALRLLRQHGLSSALVGLGGDIVVGEAPPTHSSQVSTPRQNGWRVSGLVDGAVDDLIIANAAISTSGDTEQFVEIDGVRYSHILDPRTGLGVVNSSTVTVVAPTGVLADGLSTTISVIGPEAGQELLRRFFPGVRVLASAASR